METRVFDDLTYQILLKIEKVCSSSVVKYRVWVQQRKIQLLLLNQPSIFDGGYGTPNVKSPVAFQETSTRRRMSYKKHDGGKC